MIPLLYKKTYYKSKKGNNAIIVHKSYSQGALQKWRVLFYRMIDSTILTTNKAAIVRIAGLRSLNCRVRTLLNT